MYKERAWRTEASLRACVMVMVRGGREYRCGYVEVPPGHPLHGIDYTKLDQVDVHGGLTYSGFGSGHPSDGWWFGFDCAHVWDIECEGEGCDLEYVAAECERLAQQLVQLVDFS